MIGFTSQLACTGRMYMVPLCIHAMQTDSGGGATELYTHTEEMIYLSCCQSSFGDTYKIGYIEYRINKALTSFSRNI